MHLLERRFTHFLDALYFTRDETESIKKWLRISWELAAVLVTLISLVYVWKHRSPWPAIPVLFIALCVGYRVYRRSIRCCPQCSEVEWVEDKETSAKVMQRRKWWKGWFVKKNYWREIPPSNFVHDPEFFKKDRWWDLFSAFESSEDPTRTKLLCHFHYTCLSCGLDYPVKAPELKSFDRRPRAFVNW